MRIAEAIRLAITGKSRHTERAISFALAAGVNDIATCSSLESLRLYGHVCTALALQSANPMRVVSARFVLSLSLSCSIFPFVSCVRGRANGSTNSKGASGVCGRMPESGAAYRQTAERPLQARTHPPSARRVSSLKQRLVTHSALRRIASRVAVGKGRALTGTPPAVDTCDARRSVADFSGAPLRLVARVVVLPPWLTERRGGKMAAMIGPAAFSCLIIFSPPRFPSR